jgi:transcriptional regulator with XRE-family HTH domain
VITIQPRVMTGSNGCENMTGMAEKTGSNPATHFGRQMRKERLARGWSLREFSAKTGINIGNASRIENGHRPPTAAVAEACDHAFPERRGWFLEFWEELRTWAPPGFRDWSEYEEKTTTLRDWYPGIVTGMLQTEAYAHAQLRTYPGATPEIVSTRLRARMERQQRVLFREDPPQAFFIVDEVATYRRVGSPEIMAAQLRHLLEVSAMPNVTIQVMPAVEHPANASGFVIADDSAWCENVKGGFVYTGETVAPLPALFDTLRGECMKVSESSALLERMIGTWNRLGGSPATATQTAASA